MKIDERFYQKILKVMPIPCVDILIRNRKGDVLLAKRRNEPAKGEWWFPGGRIHFLESQEDAAKRKLFEECGLMSSSFVQLGTFEAIVKRTDKLEKVHGITTVFIADVNTTSIVLDDQNSIAEWHPIDYWLSQDIHGFVQNVLESINNSTRK